jgi:hypothetical protein
LTRGLNVHELLGGADEALEVVGAASDGDPLTGLKLDDGLLDDACVRAAEDGVGGVQEGHSVVLGLVADDANLSLQVTQERLAKVAMLLPNRKLCVRVRRCGA